MACLGILVLHERRVLFPRTCLAPSIIDTRVGREVVFPRLSYSSKPSRRTMIVPSYPTPREQRCGHDRVCSGLYKNGNGPRAGRAGVAALSTYWHTTSSAVGSVLSRISPVSCNEDK
jgi:hypothetical protein